MPANDKIVPFDKLRDWCEQFHHLEDCLVVTNGCFDLLHAGHIAYLEAARALGDGLIVGLNSDASVKALKGKNRPINNERDRAIVLAALSCVTAVCIFPHTRATHFLRLAAPDIYVKGGDYTLETLDITERAELELAGSQIEFIALTEGQSTTKIIERLCCT